MGAHARRQTLPRQDAAAIDIRTTQATEHSPIEVYGSALDAVAAGGAAGLLLRYSDGSATPLPVERWAGDLGPGDHGMLTRCTGPTLDIGCGPGRLAGALARRGVPVLGVDVAAAAVASSRARGAIALRRSVFESLPGEGRWRTALLADGNVGIGGDPAALLTRCRGLLDDDGTLVVELDPPDTQSRSVRVRIEDRDGRRSSWFSWSHVSASDIDALSGECALDVRDRWSDTGRWFATLSPTGHAAHDRA